MRTLSSNNNQMLFNGGPYIAVSRDSGVSCTASPPKTTLTATREKQTIVFSVVSSSTANLHTRHWDATWSDQLQYFYIEFYDKNDVIISKLIPCYRKSDRKIGMYDVVRNTFFSQVVTNWATYFTKGGDVL